MGEKEIKPANPTGPTGPQIATPGPGEPGGWHTQERPGTGTTPKPQPPQPPRRPSGGSGTGSYSGHDRYEDGYTMGRRPDGSFYLNNPDGTTADWDPSSETWTGSDGKTKPGDCSGGHRPTKYETGPSN